MWFEWLVLDERNTKQFCNACNMIDFCEKKSLCMEESVLCSRSCADVIGRNFKPVWLKYPHNLHKTVTLLASLTEIYCIRLHCGVQINNIILIIFKQGHHNKWDNDIMLYSFCTSYLKIDWLRFQTKCFRDVTDFIWCMIHMDGTTEWHTCASQINCKV